MFKTRSLTGVFEVSILSLEGDVHYNFQYLTVRPEYIKFALWVQVLSCALLTVAVCIYTKRMKIFHWKDWIPQHKIILLLLLFQGMLENSEGVGEALHLCFQYYIGNIDYTSIIYSGTRVTHQALFFAIIFRRKLHNMAKKWRNSG